MSSPRNNFDNFFNDPSEAAEKYRPTPDKVIEALMVITSQNHEWYKDSQIRIMVLMTLAKMGMELHEEQKRTGQIPLPVHATAFCMLLGDFAAATRQYASELELEKFPDNPSDEDEDSDEE